MFRFFHFISFLIGAQEEKGPIPESREKKMDVASRSGRQLQFEPPSFGSKTGDQGIYLNRNS